MKISNKLKTARKINCYWDKSPRIRRAAYRSKLGCSEFGRWYYYIMYSGVPLPQTAVKSRYN